jgi:acyl-CoA hydrolase
MAMNSQTLSNVMKPSLEQKLNVLFDEMEERSTTPENAEERNPMEQPEFVDKMSKIIADEVSDKIIEHIKNFATVNTSVTTTIVGTSPSGPVTGTGTGTGIGGIL